MADSTNKEPSRKKAAKGKSNAADAPKEPPHASTAAGENVRSKARDRAVDEPGLWTPDEMEEAKPYPMPEPSPDDIERAKASARLEQYEPGGLAVPGVAEGGLIPGGPPAT